MNVQPHPLIVAYRQQLAAQGQYVPPLVSYPAPAPQAVAAPPVLPMHTQHLQQQQQQFAVAQPKRPLSAVDDNVIVAQTAPAPKKQKAASTATAKATTAASVPQSTTATTSTSSKAKTSKANAVKASKPAKAKEESRWPFINKSKPTFEMKRGHLEAHNCGGTYFKATGPTLEARLDKLEKFLSECDGDESMHPSYGCM